LVTSNPSSPYRNWKSTGRSVFTHFVPRPSACSFVTCTYIFTIANRQISCLFFTSQKSPNIAHYIMWTQTHAHTHTHTQNSGKLWVPVQHPRKMF
jgi:hypothetical protein